eukprot:UN33619
MPVTPESFMPTPNNNVNQPSPQAWLGLQANKSFPVNNNNNYSKSKSSNDPTLNKIPEDSGTWSCEKCTFKNHSELRSCEMCNSVRPDNGKKSMELRIILVLL